MKKYLLLAYLCYMGTGCGSPFSGTGEGEGGESGTYHEAGLDVVLPGIDGDIPESSSDDVSDAGHHRHDAGDAGQDSALPPDDAGHDAEHEAGCAPPPPPSPPNWCGSISVPTDYCETQGTGIFFGTTPAECQCLATYNCACITKYASDICKATGGTFSSCTGSGSNILVNCIVP